MVFSNGMPAGIGGWNELGEGRRGEIFVIYRGWFREERKTVAGFLQEIRMRLRGLELEK